MEGIPKKLFLVGLLFLVWGCAASPLGVGDGISAVDTNIFPHKVNWADPTVHGNYAATNGKTVCKSCHGENFQGAGKVPACYTCHSPYPHKQSWPVDHKQYLNEAGTTAECASRCHGTQLEKCNKCHQQFPHDSHWRQDHPAFVKAITNEENLPFFDISANVEVTATCTGTCHNVEESLGKMCINCHSTEIHNANWRLPENHGWAVLDNGLAKCATSCHKKDFSGGILAPSCRDCHAPYPHNYENWATSSGETNHAMTFLNGILNGEERPCFNCHGEDYLGGDTERSCNECHSLSHIPLDWVQYTTHGTNFRKEKSENASPRCYNCHGDPVVFSDIYGGVNPAAEGEAPKCYTCHAAYPHVGYTMEIGGEPQTFDWDENAPVPHVNFIQQNRTLLSGGNLNSQTLVDSIQTTCAGGDYGGCHTNGRYSTTRANDSRACNEICHSATAVPDPCPLNGLDPLNLVCEE